MSYETHYRCRDDDKRSGGLRYGEKVLAALLHMRPALDAIADSPIWRDGEIEVTFKWRHVDNWEDEPDPPEFLMCHKGHRITIEDEYGYEYDESGERKAAGDA